MNLFLVFLLSRWEGIFAGEGLNDGEWQRVRVSVNASHVTLAANDQLTVQPIAANAAAADGDAPNTTFSMTVIGELRGIYLM